jgi:hypothetical protein
MATQTLDRVAWDYMMVSPRDREQYYRLLIDSGATSILPLVHAGLRTIQEFPPARIQDHQASRTAWIHSIAVPMLENIYAVVTSIGQPGYDALCRALWNQDARVKLLAAVSLLQEPRPNLRTTKQVEEVLNEMTSRGINKKAPFEHQIIMALSNILAQGGYEQHIRILKEMGKEHNYSFEQVIETTRNTLLLSLII